MNLTPAEFTLRSLVHQMGHVVGCRAVWMRQERKRGMTYLEGMDEAAKYTATRFLREILRDHPQFKREAAHWIKVGIATAK